MQIILPDEIWAKIAMTGPRAYNLLVRAIPGLSKHGGVKGARESFVKYTTLSIVCFAFEIYDCVVPLVDDLIHTDGLISHAVELEFPEVVELNASYGKLTGSVGCSMVPAFHLTGSGLTATIYADKGRMVSPDYDTPSMSFTVSKRRELKVFAWHYKIREITYRYDGPHSELCRPLVCVNTEKMVPVVHRLYWSTALNKYVTVQAQINERVAAEINDICTCAYACLTDVADINTSITALLHAVMSSHAW